MSGKPASVGASRAGVPGAPRVLVYVDPRQLEPGAAAPDPPPPPAHHHNSHAPHLGTLYLSDNLHPQLTLPRNTIYRQSDQRNLPNTVFYKPLNEPDNIQRPEFCPASQQFVKDSCLKVEDRNERSKQEHIEKISTEYSGSETFQNRVETVDLATYQTRCSGPLGGDTMPTIQQISLRHGQNQFSESVTVHGADGSSSDRELSVGKSYVNYQILEQSVSHQSIVNQSISILNQQVGVSRGIASDVDSAGSPHLVRTADGVVLAVLPAPVPAHADNQDSSRTAQSDSPQTITVPLGWRRIITGTSVIYVSPSGTALSNQPQLREYLQTSGTCKCGLPCPLRPETAFNFDSKVVSKPYQAASGVELTKLCNHKRKLLATLQARSQSPATPPPQNTDQKKVAEVAVFKKKMKRPGFQGNVGMSQVMLQRERPLAEFKPQEAESRDIAPGMGQQRPGNGQTLPNFPQNQHIHSVPQDDNVNIKQDTQIQRSSHYLTVNNGWITQQSIDGQKNQQTSINNAMNSVGMPVLGTNGQIIGVNTGYSKNINIKNVPHAIPPSPVDTEQKDERKELSIQQNIQSAKFPQKEEDTQMFCGLNQALTPEVMQKINEQQQIFIQQNQKQIEMAMKGYKNQLADNVGTNKPQNQYSQQAQLVIQNGAVVKTNPAKTPPWQVKRNDNSSSSTITSPNAKLQKIENTDYDEQNANLSEDSSSSFSSFSSNEQVLTNHSQQGMCSRVPPLPQHYNMMSQQQWPAIDNNKKKGKGSKGSKKKNSPTENKVMNFSGNGMRLPQDSKSNLSDDIATNNVPSFMEDPSGYLAQQTVLLNNTISRQVGMNSTYDANNFDGLANSGFQHQMPQHQIDKIKSMNKPGEVLSNMYRNNVPNPSPSPNTTPDSSVINDKMDGPNPCCKGCNMSSKSNSPEYVDNQMRLKYMKHNLYKMELDGNNCTSSPKQGFDDNPVTSSTFMERTSSMSDNCSPIQAGQVSTSNVSLTETLQPPEPSPTLSNSSRSTDTPHSSGSNNSQMQPNSTYHMQSPVYANNCRDNFNSNPPTPVNTNNQGFTYSSPGSNPSISGTQMMHFISNHNVNKNLMEVDNISMVGVRPGMKPQEIVRMENRRRMENTMPGYCPPPHLGGGPAHSLIQACYVQTFVTTMASGFSVTRDTVTSVLAGKANTATTSINASQANFIRPPPPPSVNLATTYAIPNNQPDPFFNSVNLPTSYPLHIAGTTAQNMISKSPLEMVQNVIGSIPSKSEMNSQIQANSQISRRTTPGQILISSTGQIMVSNNQMPPPPPKTTTTVASGQSSGSISTNVSASVTQVVPPVGGVQPIVNQPTVVVNTLQAPFVLQPPMMAVDGQVVQQNTVLPQIVASGMVSGHTTSETTRQQIDVKSHQSYVQGVAMLSPESLKKRSKKKKNQTANITNVLQITAPQQNPNNIMVHSSPQQNTSPQFSPRGFQLSPNNNISTSPMLQALTIVPGKSGAPAHIVMNGQGNTNNFGSQQIITNTSPSQQINLLQPVNLINNASGVMSNFPAFQQFIVPNLGGMVMTADGTAIIQDNSPGMPMQLQLQTVNGQNVLTPVQNSGVFATGANGGVVIRAQNQQGKIIQSQHSPGAQFLSPNSQVMMNSPNFNGQLSPLLTNLSPSTFNTGQQVRSNVQTQEFIQTNQMGQALVLPLSPKQASTNRTNSTFVHQNTTIVQQQTTLVSNSHNASMSANVQGRSEAQMSMSTNVQGRNDGDGGSYLSLVRSLGHSVSTQTLRKSPGGSPPDTTTHSPLGVDPAASPRRAAPPRRHNKPYPDTTTSSPEPADANSSAMVQCVSSSEPDIAESREHAWPTRNEFNADHDTQNMMSNMSMMRQRPHHNPVESTDIHYNQSLTAPSTNQNPHVMPMASNYYDRPPNYKRKNDFGDGSTYRSDKIMRTNYNMVHGGMKDNDYDVMTMSDKQPRHYQASGSGAETSSMPKGFDRHNLGSSDDGKSDSDTEVDKKSFSVGDVVWGRVRGVWWPGALAARAGAAWLVRWFGGAPRARRAAADLLTLTEGLEAHHAASTNQRKSRKLNTLLESAIQEAMAELDKKSERGVTEESESTSDTPAISDTPRRHRKQDKKNKDKHHKKSQVKIAPNPNKTGEGARLRSSR